MGERKIQMEPLLAKILLYLIPHLHTGAVLDAGCNDGTDTVWLGTLMPNRTIVGIEPIRTNVAAARARVAANSINNVRILHGGLNATSGVSSYGIHAENGAGTRSQTGLLPNYQRRERVDLTYAQRRQFNVTTVDAIVDSLGLPGFALLHLDLEGNEHNALKGTSRTLARDAPVVVVETSYRIRPREHAHVLAHLKALKYVCCTVPEDCGCCGYGCRNHVCVHMDNPIVGDRPRVWNTALRAGCSWLSTRALT